MTQQEQELLKGLTDRVNGTVLANKDAEAETMLRGALGSNPNALYILCQTVLVQQFAMDNTQRQLTEARAELDRLKQAKPEEHGSFLGNLFGLGKSDSTPSQTSPAQGGYVPVHNPVQPGYGQPMTQPGYGQPVPQYGQPVPPYGYGAPAMGGGMFGGGGGFLQGAAQTAAGVVAGEFAFRALEDVFHGFGGGGEGRGFGGGTEINNYYDDAGDRGSGDGFADRLQQADGLDGSISPDIEDRRGDSSGFLDSSSGVGNDFAAGADSDSGDADTFGGDDFSSGDSGGSDDSY